MNIYLSFYSSFSFSLTALLRNSLHLLLSFSLPQRDSIKEITRDSPLTGARGIKNNHSYKEDKIMVIIQKDLQAQIDAKNTLKERLEILQPEINYQTNDRDYSRLFAEVVHSRLLYNISSEQWMYYNGKYWEPDIGEIHIKRFMKEFSRALSLYVNELDPEIYKDLISFVSDLGKASRRAVLIKDAFDVYTVKEEDFDKNPLLFNCDNVTIDLATRTSHPHTAEDMITKYSPVIFDPNATSDFLDSFMNQIFCNDKELISYVYRLFGYSLTGLTKEECFFIMLGESSRNGKSTLLSMFTHLLGGCTDSGYARDIGIETLAQRKYLNGSAPSPDIAKLKGSRFITCSEPPEDFIMDEAKLKTMTGGDKISARMLYKNEISFIPTFKIAMATNHRPVIQDDSVLKSNRIRVIPFNRHFSDEEQDKNLKSTLTSKEVQSALLNKCLNGYASYESIGLHEPKAVIDATAKYQTATEILELFMTDSLVASSDGRLKLSIFYDYYSDWCESRSIFPQPKRKIMAALRAKGVLRSTATVNGKTERNVIVGYCLANSVPPIVATVVSSPSTGSGEEKHKPKPVHIPEFEEFKHSMQEPQTADELSALKLLDDMFNVDNM